MPKSSRSSFPVSTVEWIASLYMAALPVTSAAPNLQIAIATLPAIAAMMTRSEPECSATIPPPLPPLCYEHELSAVALGGVAFAPGLSRPRRHRSCRIPPGTAAVSRRSPTVIKTGVSTRLGWLSDQDSNLNRLNSNLEERAVIASVVMRPAWASREFDALRPGLRIADSSSLALWHGRRNLRRSPLPGAPSASL